MVVRYNRVWGWVMLGLSGLLFMLCLVRFDVCVMFSAVCTLLPGYIYISRPWLTVKEDGVVFEAIIDSLKRSYEGRPRVEGAYLVAADGTKIGHRRMADQEDWTEMEKMLAEK